MKLLLILTLSIFAYSCSDINSNADQTKVTKIISIKDSTKFPQFSMTLVKDNLYRDSTNSIYFKTLDRSFSDSTPTVERYIDVVYSDKFENEGIEKMKNVIDTSTFKNIGTIFYQDKNNIYVFNEMLDGGTFAIIDEVDFKSFKVLEATYYAKDKKHIFYKGAIIDSVDFRTFTILPLLDNGDTIRWLGMDKANVYDGNSVLDKQTLKDWNIKR